MELWQDDRLAIHRAVAVQRPGLIQASDPAGKNPMLFMYELDIRTLGELLYFLFRKKKCPRCGGKLSRAAVLPEFSSGWKREGLDFEYAYKTKEAVRYRCDPCHAYYTLAELAGRA